MRTGNIGNTIFILITGYYMIDKRVNHKKILLLLLAIFFYYWLFAIIVYSGHIEVNKVTIELTNSLWRKLVCIMLHEFSLFIPYINKLLNAALIGRQYLELLLRVLH